MEKTRSGDNKRNNGGEESVNRKTWLDISLKRTWRKHWYRKRVTKKAVDEGKPFHLAGVLLYAGCRWEQNNSNEGSTPKRILFSKKTSVEDTERPKG